MTTPTVKQSLETILLGLDEFVEGLNIRVRHDDEADFVFWMGERNPATLWLKLTENDEWRLSLFNIHSLRVELLHVYKNTSELLFLDKNLVFYIKELLT